MSVFHITVTPMYANPTPHADPDEGDSIRWDVIGSLFDAFAAAADELVARPAVVKVEAENSGVTYEASSHRRGGRMRFFGWQRTSPEGELDPDDIRELLDRDITDDDRKGLLCNL